jgi:excinuclease ABC subunit A
MKDIHLWGVKQNNLKNIEVRIPLGSFTVICGPSGSGKSSLAFQTLFAEGQRRFIESMSNYARQFLNSAPKPDLEGIENIPPAIAIEQKNGVKNSRSTVGTTTEVVDYLRVLFDKLGQAYCPTHNIPTSKESVTDATDKTLNAFLGKRGYLLVEITKEGRAAEGRKLHSLLLTDGYRRIYVTSKKKKVGEIIEIGNPEAVKKGLPTETFFLVVDRLAFSTEERDRLADSMNQAYQASRKYNLNQIAAAATVLTIEGEILRVSEDECCSICGYQPPQTSVNFFSFNSPMGACPTCKGFGNTLEIDEKKVIPNDELTIAQGALNPFTMPSAAADKKALLAYCKKEKISVDTPWKILPPEHREMIWNGTKEFFGVKGLFKYLEEMKYKMHVRVFISRYRSPSVCPDCHGFRLRKEAQNFQFKGYSLGQLCHFTIEKLVQVFDQLNLTSAEQAVADEIFRQVKARLSFLLRVGVHYLTLSRETRTLSGGEYQRLILANQLGMGLSQTLYVLDEPTIGLHPRDNDRLISILKDIKNLGNTLVVVEHDQDVIENSDNIIEMGPGSGYLGGQVIYSGNTKSFYDCKESITVPFLNNKSSKILTKTERRVDIDNYKYKISIKGASGHNLKNIDVVFPLNRLIAITGVSGSGKSTLVTKTLYPAIARQLDLEYLPCQPYDKIEGCEYIKNVILIDQSAIGKSTRSNPMTYLKAFDIIRNIMAATPEAKSKGYTAGTFSLNVDGGRCPACRGTGVEEIDMVFMDNVMLPCEVCDGLKYQNEVLEILFNEKNINQIMDMTVEEAMTFFINHPNIRKSLLLLKEVGLEYLRLGQAANSLSGGESQRLKIAKELNAVNQKQTLYILDEPTTGLHFREVNLLMKVLHKLIDAGGSVIVIEHNLDVIRNSDYIIDLGPDGGTGGGELVAQGTPEMIITSKISLTGQYLKNF